MREQSEASTRSDAVTPARACPFASDVVASTVVPRCSDTTRGTRRLGLT